MRASLIGSATAIVALCVALSIALAVRPGEAAAPAAKGAAAAHAGKPDPAKAEPPPAGGIDTEARSAFIVDNLAQATALGLIASRLDTWSVRPAVNLQYILYWDRTIITVSSDSTYFHTEDFISSNSYVKVDGNSQTLGGTLDVDIPLGIELDGHELRSGGYFSHTELSGDLKKGLNVDSMNELHGRLVLDVLDQVWRLRWIGIGGSYFWGPRFAGWTIDADVAFRF